MKKNKLVWIVFLVNKDMLMIKVVLVTLNLVNQVLEKLFLLRLVTNPLKIK